MNGMIVREPIRLSRHSGLKRQARPEGAPPHAGPAAEAAAGGDADQRAELSARDLWANICDFGALPVNYGDRQTRLVFPARDGSDLVGLKLRHVDAGDRLIIELSATRRRSLEPAIHGVPRQPLHSRDRRFADTFDDGRAWS